MSFPFGRKIQVRKPEETDLEKIASWLHDPSFIKHLYGSPLHSLAEFTQKARHLLSQNAKDTSPDFTLIMESKTGQPIGLMMFRNINWKDRNTEINLAIGEQSFRNSYYGVEAFVLTLLVGFHELNLHKIYGYIYHTNSSSEHIVKQVGNYEGTLRDHYYRDGEFVDVNVYSCFSSQLKDSLLRLKDGVLKKSFDQGYFSEYT
ncbi:MAG: GNAT family protein [Candidatus Margulisiibacteriota bacterium]